MFSPLLKWNHKDTKGTKLFLDIYQESLRLKKFYHKIPELLSFSGEAAFSKICAANFTK